MTHDPQQWEKDILAKAVMASVTEQRLARRWRIFFRLLILSIIVIAIIWGNVESGDETDAHDHKLAGVLKIDGVLAPGNQANAEDITRALRKQFKKDEIKAIVLNINSPGGTPVQAAQIYDEIMRLKKLHPKKKVVAVIDDVGASGAYYVAAAADKIYASRASLVGSIGVLFNGFGFTEGMKNFGVERRLMTAGDHKAMMDPFSPVKEQDQASMQVMLDNIHQQFINSVKRTRGKKIKHPKMAFSGQVFTGEQALQEGLIDGFGDTATVIRQELKLKHYRNITPRSNPLDKFSGFLSSQLDRLPLASHQGVVAF